MGGGAPPCHRMLSSRLSQNVKETIANNEKNYGNRENWAVGGKNGNQQFETTKQ